MVAITIAMQLDVGYAFRSRAKPEWSYETSSMHYRACIPILSLLSAVARCYSLAATK
jgi:hypothetical protein